MATIQRQHYIDAGQVWIFVQNPFKPDNSIVEIPRELRLITQQEPDEIVKMYTKKEEFRGCNRCWTRHLQHTKKILPRNETCRYVDQYTKQQIALKLVEQLNTEKSNDQGLDREEKIDEDGDTFIKDIQQETKHTINTLISHKKEVKINREGTPTTKIKYPFKPDILATDIIELDTDSSVSSSRSSVPFEATQIDTFPEETYRKLIKEEGFKEPKLSLYPKDHRITLDLEDGRTQSKIQNIWKPKQHRLYDYV